MKTAIVIPAYNEAAKIYDVVHAVIAEGYDALVIDDCSRDDTAERAARAGAFVIRHPINRGYGAALATGNAWALKNGYECIVHFDADGQHNPKEIAPMRAELIRGEADVVIGSRFLPGASAERISAPRRALVRMAVFFTWGVSGIKLTDAHNGFRAFTRRALEHMDCRQDGMSYASEVIDQIASLDLRIKEIPVTIAYTDYSKAKGEGNVAKVLLGVKFLWGKFVK